MIENDYRYLNYKGVQYLLGKIKSELLPSMLTYKGYVEHLSDLAAYSSTASTGDVYHVNDTGAEYFWNGSDWEYAGEIVSEFKYTNNAPTPSTIGGIAAGTTFSNVTLKDLFDSLLYPYVAPTASVSVSPSKFEYDTGNGTSLTFTLTKTAGSKTITSYSIDGVANTITATRTGTTGDVQVSGSVTDGTTTLSPSATAKVAYRCYLGFASDVNTAKTNFESSNLYTSVSGIGQKSATGSGNLYFIIKGSWWTNGYTLKSSVGPMSIDSANISTFTHKGMEYTAVLVGSYSQGTQSFTIQ